MITQINTECINNNEDVNPITFNLWDVAHSVVGYSVYTELENKYSNISNSILTTRFKQDILRIINRQSMNKLKN